MATNNQDDHERAAAGLDFDNPIREKAASLGQTVATARSSGSAR